MKKLLFSYYKLFAAAFILLAGNAWGQVFISQYVETNSGTTPKGIEVFNASSSDIIFSESNNLQIYQGTNGAACSALSGLNITSGTLKSGEVWVIGTYDVVSYANTNGANLSGTTTFAFAFNGNDALQLILGGTLLDVFGTCGNDPGSAWSGGGVSTENQNIQTLTTITSGTTSNWTNPSLRFETVSTTNALTGFGNAPYALGCNTAAVTSHPVSQNTTTAGTATFSAAGTGAVQWQQNTGSAWTDIPNGGVFSGATTSTLTITKPPVTMNGYQYRAVLTQTCDGSSATSNPATLNVTTYVGPCGTEDFSLASLTTPYATGSFTGNNGIVWSYVNSRDEGSYPIVGKGILFQGNTSAYVSGTTVSGVGTLTFQARKAFTGGSNNRSLGVYINGTLVYTTPTFGTANTDTTVHTFTVENINVEGNVSIRIQNATSNQVTIDNISWTCYTAAPQPPAITSALTHSSEYGAAASYQIAADNAPTSFNATGLPAGLSVNTATGLISGTVTGNAGNYNVSISATNDEGTDTKTLVWTVTRKPVTLTGFVFNKVYDGTTAAANTGTITLNGILPADASDVGFSGTPTFTYNNKNAGNRTVARSGNYSLTGTKRTNYQLAQPTGLTGVISKKDITLSGVTAQDKTYDGTAGATFTGGTLEGIVDGDTAPTFVVVGNFNNANVGTGKPVTVTAVNLSGTEAGNYNVNPLPSGLTANITKGTPTILPESITVNAGGTYVLPGGISSDSDGALSFSMVDNSFATLTGGNTINGLAAGINTLTVNQEEGTNHIAGTATITINVTEFVYQNGDVRPLDNNANFSTGGNAPYRWEQYNNGIWSNRADSPQQTKPSRIIIHKQGIVAGNNAANTYNNIVVLNGGELILNQNIEPTADFIGNNRTLEIQDGGSVKLDGQIRFNSNANFIIREGGTFILNNASIGNSHGFWYGKENFEQGSTFKILRHMNTGTSEASLINVITDITSNATGSKFGNLIIDVPLTDEWVLVGGNIDIVLCDYLEVKTNTVNSGRPLCMFSNAGQPTAVVRGDIVHKGGLFALTSTFSYVSSSTKQILTIDGNLKSEAGTIWLYKQHTGTDTPANNSFVVNLKGNFEVASGVTVNSQTDLEATSSFNFTGNTLQTINVVPAVNRWKMYVKNLGPATGATVQLINHDLQLGTNGTFTVENKGTLDFGFTDVATPLNIVRSGTVSGTAFENMAGGILKITSPEGIMASGSPVNYTSGNVRTTTRTFAPAATYHFIGKTNQNTGTGVPIAAANKHIIVELENDDLEFRSNNGIVRFNNLATDTGTNFRGLEIRKGTVIADDAGNRFQDSSAEDQVGNLKMTGGIYKIFTRDIQPAVSGKYELSAGSKIIFAHTNVNVPPNTATNQAIRGAAAYEYPEIEVQGKDVRYSNSNVNMKSNGLFTVMPDAVLLNTGSAGQIVSLDNANPAQLIVKGNGTFRTQKEKGFNGVPDSINPAPSVRTNHSSGNVIITLEDGSTVDYSREGNQTITSFKPLESSEANLETGGYYNLKISGFNGELEGGTAKTISVNEPIYVRNNLSVENEARLVIDAEKAMIVRNTVTNNAGNPYGIIVESDGNLKQINPVQNSTNISVRRLHTWSGDLRKEYNFLSSPVALSSSFTMKHIYGNIPANILFVTVLNEKTNLFVNATAANYLDKAKGFAVKEPKTSYIDMPELGLQNDEAQYLGVPNNGNITIDIFKSASNRGWNLLGNPYPSNIDLLKVYEDNEAALLPEFRFWDNTYNNTYTQYGGNYQGYSYAIYNAASDEGNPAPGGDINGDNEDPVGAMPDDVVSLYRVARVSQGFLIRSKGNVEETKQVNFTNQQRMTNKPEYKFFGRNEMTKDRYRLQLITSDSLHMTQTVLYFDRGNNSFGLEDSRHPSTGASDAFYSFADEEKTIINGRSLFDADDVLSLGTKHFAAGTYRIRATGKVGVFANGQSIYLKDKELGIITDLTESDYTFTSNAGEYSNRFEIVYKPGAVLDTGNPLQSTFEVFRDGTDFVVRASEIISQLELYDVSGRLMLSVKPAQKTYRFAAEKITDGIYVVKTTWKNGETKTKKIRK